MRTFTRRFPDRSGPAPLNAVLAAQIAQVRDWTDELAHAENAQGRSLTAVEQLNLATLCVATAPRA